MKVQRCPESNESFRDNFAIFESSLQGLGLSVSNSRGYLTPVVKNASSSEMRAKLEHVCVKEEFQLE